MENWFSGTPIHGMEAFDRATDVVTLALGPGYAVSAERSCLWGICSPTGSGPPCSPRGSLPGQGRPRLLLDSPFSVYRAPTCPISGSRLSASASYSRWLWPGSVLISRTVLNRGLDPDSLRSPRAGPRAGFLGPVSHGCCHDPAPPVAGPRPATTGRPGTAGLGPVCRLAPQWSRLVGWVSHPRHVVLRCQRSGCPLR